MVQSVAFTPWFTAAANPAFVGLAIRRTPCAATSSRVRSLEALSTTRISASREFLQSAEATADFSRRIECDHDDRDTGHVSMCPGRR